MSVTENDLRPVINDLLNAYPVFSDWFSGLLPQQRDGMIAAWARQVASLHPSDVRSAADRILDGRVAMPKNYEFDRLGFELRTWGGVEAAQRMEREKSVVLREQAQPTADPSTRGVGSRFGQAIKCASSWGTACKLGLVTAEANRDAMVVIHRYHQQGDAELVWPDVPASQHKDVVSFWQVPAK